MNEAAAAPALSYAGSRDASRSRRPVWVWAALAVIVVVGFSLRLYNLDAQSIWADEASSIAASHGTLDELRSNIIRASSHPPFHYYLLNAAYRVLGFGTWQARFVSALLGTLAICALYAVADMLFDPSTALVSAALLATSQLGLMYSQEARPYATLLCFSLLTQLLFLRAVRTSRASTWCAFVIAATLTVDTHYYGAFLVAALFVYWMTVRKHYAIPAWWWLGGALAGAALLAPWVFGGMPEQMAYWVPQAVRDVQPPWFSTTWLTPIRTLNMFNNGKFSGVLDSAPRWTFVTGSLVYTLPAIAAILTAVDRSAPAGQGFARRDAILFLVITAGVPFVAAVGLGFKGVVYDVRYVSFCVAPYYVLVAHGLTRIRWTPVRGVCIAAAVLYGAASLRANYLIPYKENYRDALAYLAAEYRPGDVCVFEPSNIPMQWQIYHPGHPGLVTASLDETENNASTTGRIWFIASTRAPNAEMHVREIADRLGAKFTKLDERRYFWVVLYLYAHNLEKRPDTIVAVPGGRG